MVCTRDPGHRSPESLQDIPLSKALVPPDQNGHLLSISRYDWALCCLWSPFCHRFSHLHVLFLFQGDRSCHQIRRLPHFVYRRHLDFTSIGCDRSLCDLGVTTQTGKVLPPVVQVFTHCLQEDSDFKIVQGLPLRQFLLQGVA